MSKSSTAKLAMYDEFSVSYGDLSSANGSYIVSIRHLEFFLTKKKKKKKY